MRVDSFDFDLPSNLVALRPQVPRESARLLVVKPDGRVEHAEVRNLPEFLDCGTEMILNDTRVMPARLDAVRPEGGGRKDVAVIVNLHKRRDARRYTAFARPFRRLRDGDELVFAGGLRASVKLLDDGEIELVFNQEGTTLDTAITAQGRMPIPPYIARLRGADDRDNADYQTIYARHPGSVAAPTAGLHFTPELFARLAERGISRHAVTLHVGAGTFLPVRVDDTNSHRMHSEWASLSAETAKAINTARRAGKPIMAVGTTSVRTLESATGKDDALRPFAGDTNIFITPGYRFRVVDILLTNFHLPRSTLFMLVCAFCGLDTMREAYAEAIRKKYRFYSYGDACLLFRPR